MHFPPSMTWSSEAACPQLASLATSLLTIQTQSEKRIKRINHSSWSTHKWRRGRLSENIYTPLTKLQMRTHKHTDRPRCDFQRGSLRQHWPCSVALWLLPREQKHRQDLWRFLRWEEGLLRLRQNGHLAVWKGALLMCLEKREGAQGTFDGRAASPWL